MLKAVNLDVDRTLTGSVNFNARTWQNASCDLGRQADVEDIRRQNGKAEPRTVRLPRGGFVKQHLRDAGCDAICASPAGLLAGCDRSPLARPGMAW